MSGKEAYVRWFSELSKKDISIAGMKGAMLGDMYNKKFPVPAGFVVTSEAYKHFISKNGLQKHIMNILRETNIDDDSALRKASEKIRGLIEHADFPEDLKREVLESYEILDSDKTKYTGASAGALDILRTGHEPPFVAVRSSVISPETEGNSFAGQHETFLNVKNSEKLIENVKKAFSSIFRTDAIYYRAKRGILHEQTFAAAIIQEMIDSEKSGVVFSRNPLTNDDGIMIEAVWGLGEGLISGLIKPDNYVLNKNLDFLDKKIEHKEIALARNSSGKTEAVKLQEEISKREVLTGYELKILSQLAMSLENEYGYPQNVEFASSEGKVYVLQTRPVVSFSERYDKEIEGNVVARGRGVSPGVVTGSVKVVRDQEDLKNAKDKILVIENYIGDLGLVIQKASGIVLSKGGTSSAYALIARETGIPVVVSEKASEKLRDNDLVTIDGYNGKVIQGEAVEKDVSVKEVVSTKTKIGLILDNPDYAKSDANSGVGEIGLARLEKVNSYIGKHPIWYIKNSKTEEYSKDLYENLRKIVLPYKKAKIRTSDLKSDEYRNLEGAPEKQEKNPLLGDHGIRFSLRNIDLFEAELRAIKDLADEYEGKEFGIILPQVISSDEIVEAKKSIQEVGMPDNVILGVMIETPAAVQIVNDILNLVDFISIGPDDLTQHTLAVDRNNEHVSELYDEMNPALLNSIKYVIRRAKKYRKEVSLCWQANTEIKMAGFLAEQGIDCINVRADAAHEVSKAVAEAEGASGFVKETGDDCEGGICKVPDLEPKEEVKGDVERAEESDIESINEEALVLKALEESDDNYNPSISRESDIPSLNEAIPIGSEHLMPENEEQFVEVNLPGESFDFFDKLQENVFKEFVFAEYEKAEAANRAEAEQAAKEKEQKQSQGGAGAQGLNEVMDIF